MPSKRKFYRQVVAIEILSEEPINFSLAEIAEEIKNGDCSGVWNVTEDEEIDAPTCAKLLIKQGSDPEFFQIDENGNDLEEED